jgi:hypothetical protein
MPSEEWKLNKMCKNCGVKIPDCNNYCSFKCYIKDIENISEEVK